MRRYAEDTRVEVSKSKADVDQLISQHGGDMISFGWRDPETQVLAFRWQERFYRFEIEHDGIDREDRRRWRVLFALRLKPLFELSIEDMAAAQDMLLANLMLPNGATVGDEVIEEVSTAYRTGEMPALRLGPTVRALPPGGYR